MKRGLNTFAGLTPSCGVYTAATKASFTVKRRLTRVGRGMTIECLSGGIRIEEAAKYAIQDVTYKQEKKQRYHRCRNIRISLAIIVVPIIDKSKRSLLRSS